MVTECLSFVYVRYVYLHKWNVHACQSISQRNTGMRQGAWIDYDGVDVPSRLVYAVDYRALPIRLEM